MNTRGRQAGQDEALTPIVVEPEPVNGLPNNTLSDLCHRNFMAQTYFDILRLRLPGEKWKEYNGDDIEDLRRAYARFKRAAKDIDKIEKRLLARAEALGARDGGRPR